MLPICVYTADGVFSSNVAVTIRYKLKRNLTSKLEIPAIAVLVSVKFDYFDLRAFPWVTAPTTSQHRGS